MNADDDNLEELFIVLDPREEWIIRARFAIDTKFKTLDELGRAFEVGRERIRQMQNIALSKLRRAYQQRIRFLEAGMKWPLPDVVKPPYPKVATREQKEKLRQATRKAPKRAVQRDKEEAFLPQQAYYRPIQWFTLKWP